MTTAHPALARRYAKALYVSATEQEILPLVEKDVLALAAAFSTSPELVRAAKSPLVEKREQAALIESILVKLKAQKLTRAWAGLMAANRRLSLLPETAEAFRALLAEEKGESVADVTSAAPLSEAQKTRIAEQLQQVTGKRIQLRPFVNKNILGGLIITLESKMLDSSIKGRLDRLALAQKQVAL